MTRHPAWERRRCIAVAWPLHCRCVVLSLHRCNVAGALSSHPSHHVGIARRCIQHIPAFLPGLEAHRGPLSLWLFLVAAKPGRGGGPTGWSAGPGLGCSTSVGALSLESQGLPSLLLCSQYSVSPLSREGQAHAGSITAAHLAGRRVPAPFYKKQCSCNKEFNNPLCLCG